MRVLAEGDRRFPILVDYTSPLVAGHDTVVWPGSVLASPTEEWLGAPSDHTGRFMPRRSSLLPAARRARGSGTVNATLLPDAGPGSACKAKRVLEPAHAPNRQPRRICRIVTCSREEQSDPIRDDRLHARIPRRANL